MYPHGPPAHLFRGICIDDENKAVLTLTSEELEYVSQGYRQRCYVCERGPEPEKGRLVVVFGVGHHEKSARAERGSVQRRVGTLARRSCAPLLHRPRQGRLPARDTPGAARMNPAEKSAQARTWILNMLKDRALTHEDLVDLVSATFKLGHVHANRVLAGLLDSGQVVTDDGKIRGAGP